MHTCSCSPVHIISVAMYMQHVESGVAGQTRPRAFELVEGEFDLGSRMAREVEAARKLMVVI